MNMTGTHPQPPRPPCRHDSQRLDGTLDDHCLRCGADGYWHEGHKHYTVHPCGKVLIRLACPVWRVSSDYCVAYADKVERYALTKLGARWLAWRLQFMRRRPDAGH